MDGFVHSSGHVRGWCRNISTEICSRRRGHMRTEVTKKLFTVDEYYKMGEAGILGPEDRVELINGEILEMSPIGNPHVACVDRANALFAVAFVGKAIVSVQNPVLLNTYNEPQPDVVLMKARPDFYKTKRHMP